MKALRHIFTLILLIGGLKNSLPAHNLAGAFTAQEGHAAIKESMPWGAENHASTMEMPLLQEEVIEEDEDKREDHKQAFEALPFLHLSTSRNQPLLHSEADQDQKQETFYLRFRVLRL